MLPALIPVVAFLKKYWEVIAVVAIPVAIIVGYLVFRPKPPDFVDDFKKVEAAHAIETKKIDDARQEEIKKLDANQKQLDQHLADNTVKHDDAVKDLADKKKDEVKTIVKNDGNDPEKLAQDLIAVLGGNVKVIMPEDPK